MSDQIFSTADDVQRLITLQAQEQAAWLTQLAPRQKAQA